MDSKELRGLYEAYSEVYAPVDEAVKGEPSERRKDLAAERKAGHRPLPAKEGEKYASHKLAQMAYAKRKRMEEEVEEVDEALSGDRIKKVIRKPGGTDYTRMHSADPNKRPTKRGGRGERGASKQHDFGATDRGAGNRAARRAGKSVEDTRYEEVDIFDVVLEFLQAEGYAETLEEAEWIMANELDAEDIDSILGEGKSSRPRYPGGRGVLDQERRDEKREASAENLRGHTAGPGTVTKNPKKLRKQKAMGEHG